SAVQTGADSPPLPPPPPSIGPGASLKTARERAGLSLDDVAQALKLAPRQVRALEEEDFAQLPGRTFARGFVRNYARLLHLDSDGLLAQLPDATHAPALAAPSLHSTGGTMGEVPVAKAARSGLGRWLIPLLLVIAVVGAGAYEWYRSERAAPSETVRDDAAPPTVQAPTPSTGTARSELPNPIAAAVPGAIPAGNRDSATTPSQPVTTPEPQSPASAQSSGADVSPPANAAAPDTGSASASAAMPEATAPLVLTYRASAWTQVRDGKGQVVLLRTVPAGSEQAVRGTPPFDIVIGNARAVTLAYRGQPIDLARYTRGNIARLRLQ
ncbi:MAG TPA: RodZ domain-containing protein, partial [Caldimonas sp.]|nr:RodZ domain-containing protein [Caldimonas sp.]